MPYEIYQVFHWIDNLNSIDMFIYFFALIGGIDVFLWIVKKIA